MIIVIPEFNRGNMIMVIPEFNHIIMFVYL